MKNACFVMTDFIFSESWILLYVYIVEDVGYMAIFAFYCMFLYISK